MRGGAAGPPDEKGARQRPSPEVFRSSKSPEDSSDLLLHQRLSWLLRRHRLRLSVALATVDLAFGIGGGR
jgi:hypothetical protein